MICITSLSSFTCFKVKLFWRTAHAFSHSISVFFNVRIIIVIGHPKLNQSWVCTFFYFSLYYSSLSERKIIIVIIKVRLISEIGKCLCFEGLRNILNNPWLAWGWNFLSSFVIFAIANWKQIRCSSFSLAGKWIIILRIYIFWYRKHLIFSLLIYVVSFTFLNVNEVVFEMSFREFGCFKRLL